MILLIMLIFLGRGFNNKIIYLFIYFLLYCGSSMSKIFYNKCKQSNGEICFFGGCNNSTKRLSVFAKPEFAVVKLNND